MNSYLGSLTVKKNERKYFISDIFLPSPFLRNELLYKLNCSDEPNNGILALVIAMQYPETHYHYLTFPDHLVFDRTRYKRYKQSDLSVFLGHSGMTVYSYVSAHALSAKIH